MFPNFVMFMRNLPSVLMWILVVSFALQISPAIGLKYTHLPMNGYYCVNGYKSNYSAIEHQQCAAHCITDQDCWLLVYNWREKYCILGTQPCANAVADFDFRMMTFRKYETLYWIQWVWSDGSSYPVRTVEQVYPQHEALARRLIEGEVYIGRGNHRYGKIYLARHGAAASYLGYYLLVVSDSCSVAWVPYSAGNPLPRGAVKGGYLDSLGTTYCIRVSDMHTTEPAHVFGYYVPSIGFGYYAWWGCKTTTQMEILVQIHLFY